MTPACDVMLILRFIYLKITFILRTHVYCTILTMPYIVHTHHTLYLQCTLYKYIYSIMRPFLLRRLKKDVAKQLPGNLILTYCCEQ